MLTTYWNLILSPRLHIRISWSGNSTAQNMYILMYIRIVKPRKLLLFKQYACKIFPLINDVDPNNLHAYFSGTNTGCIKDAYVNEMTSS